MDVLRVALLVLFAGCSVNPRLNAPPDPPSLAFTHVTVIDVARGVPLPDQTVVVTGHRIASAGPASSVRVPRGAQVIDVDGRYMIPGLWDMHTHPEKEEDLALFIANGITGIRVMHGEPRHLEWREQIRRGERLGPVLFVAGPIIEGPPPPALASVIPTEGKRLVHTAEEAAGEIRAQKAVGYDFIKVYNNLPRAAYEAIVAEARRLKLRVAGHVPFEVGLAGALKARQASIEHLRGYIEPLVPPGAPQQPGADFRSRALAWRFADPSKMKALAEATRDAEVWNTPTLACRIDTRPHAEVEAYLGRPEAAYLSKSHREMLRDRSQIGYLSNFTAEDFRYAADGYLLEDALIRALQNAGARLLAGTDLVPWGFSLHRELEELVSAGLSPREALAAATRNPAEFLNAADSFGTVREGKRADLVLLGANPLEDIRNTQRIQAVVIDGRLLNRRTLDELLATSKKSIAKQ